ncbi:MAG: hypothetical protein KC425_02845 [Anaerolineales bacterium]|nr:hypothetical protein [Anaerolineales bacterium]
MDFGNLFSRAWQIVWRNKFLFVLGFLASLGSNGGSNSSSIRGDASSFDVPPGTMDTAEQFFAQYGGLLLAGACVLMMLGIVLWLLRLTAQGGLISAADRIDRGEQVSFGEAFAAGASKLGRLIGVNLLMYGPFLLLGLLAFGVFGLTVGTAVLQELSGGSAAEEILTAFLGFFACFGLLACLLVPLWLLVSLIYPFAQRGVVLGERGVVDAIRHGWQIVRANAGDVLILAVIFVILGIVVGFAAFIIILPLGLLLFVPAIVGLASGGSIGVGEVVYLLGSGICVGLLAAAVNSILVAFRSTAVTLAYREFLARGKAADVGSF